MTAIKAHHDAAQLWAYASGELDAARAAALTAHIEDCAMCAQALDDVRESAALLRPAHVPELSDARWRAIDKAVFDRAAKEFARPRGFRDLIDALTGALPALPAPALVAAGLVLVVGGMAYRYAYSRHQRPEAIGPVAVAPKPELAPEPAPIGPSPQELPRIAQASETAAVVLAVRARTGEGGKLSRGARVTRGSRIQTQKNGEAWLVLPEGSRAGVVGEGSVELAAVSPDDVKIDVQRGALLVSATKRTGRAFSVTSGGIEVRVVGTRFLVANDGSRTDVAVEEGAVEVVGPFGTRRVATGARVSVREGDQTVSEQSLTAQDRNRFLDLMPDRPRTAAAAMPKAVMPAVPDTPPIPVPAPETSQPDAPVVQLSGPSAVPSSARPEDEPESASVGAPPTPEPRETTPFAEATGDRAQALEAQSVEDHRLDRLGQQVSRDNCFWIVEKLTAWREERELSRLGVQLPPEIKALTIKARCMEIMGRHKDAAALRRQINTSRPVYVAPPPPSSFQPLPPRR